MSSIDRRSFLRGGLSAAALGAVGAATACTSSPAVPVESAGGGLIGSDSTQVAAAEAARHTSGRVVSAVLDATPGPVDLGGITVHTWSYRGEVPGPEIGPQGRHGSGDAGEPAPGLHDRALARDRPPQQHGRVFP